MRQILTLAILGISLCGCVSQPIVDVGRYNSSIDVALATINADLKSQWKPILVNPDIKSGTRSRMLSIRAVLFAPKFTTDLGAYCRHIGGQFDTFNGAMRNSINERLCILLEPDNFRDDDTVDSKRAANYYGPGMVEGYRCTKDGKDKFLAKKWLVWIDKLGGNVIEARHYGFAIVEID